jgi:hypothetical protein
LPKTEKVTKYLKTPTKSCQKKEKVKKIKDRSDKKINVAKNLG